MMSALSILRVDDCRHGYGNVTPRLGAAKNFVQKKDPRNKTPFIRNNFTGELFSRQIVGAWTQF
jgi:hypothetical protein